MNKKCFSQWFPHIIAVGSFVVFIVLGLACATMGPTVPVELSESYRVYLQPPSGNERTIDTVGVRGGASFVCRDGEHSITAEQRLGATYQVPENRAGEKHRHEAVFGQLVNEAQKQYPSEEVAIKNARTGRHVPTNARREEYTAYNSNGQAYTAMRTVWDCFPYYFADVVTTEPMPNPVTHTENFTMPGLTRNDIYRRAYNWLEDNTQRRRITITSENFDRGRIVGTVTGSARADQTYLITSPYTIDVYDARVEIRFAEATLQRTDASLQSAGRPEPIFLQSIADATLAELADFSTSLRSYIVSR